MSTTCPNCGLPRGSAVFTCRNCGFDLRPDLARQAEAEKAGLTAAPSRSSAELWRPYARPSESSPSERSWWEKWRRWIPFAVGALLFLLAGNQMIGIHSESGDSIAEAFYHAMGYFCWAMACFCGALGAVLS